MPNCYTCDEEIIFDKNVLSKTGKPIPLWPDKQNTHGHDENGNPIRGPLPTANLNPQQTQQFNQYNREQPQQQTVKPATGFPSTSSGPSQGGSYLDTKRLRVMTEETQILLLQINEKVEACYQLAKSNNIMLGEIIQYLKLNDPKKASELYEAMEHTKKEALKPAEVKGWNSVPNPTEERLRDNNDDD